MNMNYKRGRWYNEKPEYRKFEKMFRGCDVEGGGYAKNRKHYLRIKMGVSPCQMED